MIKIKKIIPAPIRTFLRIIRRSLYNLEEKTYLYVLFLKDYFAFKKMSADSVIIMDGDDQHDPRDIKNFLKSLKRGNEIVLGVRSLDANMPLARVLGNKAMSILINILFGHYLADIPSGFKAFTKKAYKKIFWHSSGYEVETEIAVRIAKQDLAYQEIPINTVYHGKDYGFNLLDAWRILIRIPYWLWR